MPPQQPAPGGDEGLRPATYDDILRFEAKRQKVPYHVARQVVERESKGNLEALGRPVESGERAVGLFQLMHAAADDMNVDPKDPVQNIRGGVGYLRRQLDATRNAEGLFNVREALLRYHGGGDPKNWGPVTNGYADDILAAIKKQTDAEKAGGGAVAPGTTIRLDPAQALPTFPALGTARTPSTRRGGAPESTYLTEKLAQDRARRQGFGFGGAPPTVGSPEGGYTLQSEAGTPPPPPDPKHFEDIGPFFQISKPTAIGSGAAIGGATGARLGAPLGPLATAVGTVGGAYVGGHAGYLADQLVAEGARRLDNVGLPPPRPTAYELAAEAHEAGMEGAASELAGQVGSRVLDKTLAPFANKLAPHAKAAMERFRGTKGEPLTLPGEVSTSKFLNFWQNIADFSLFGKGPGQVLRAERQKVAERQAWDLLGDLDLPVLTATETGGGTKAAHKAAVAQFREAEAALWQGTPEKPGYDMLAREIPAPTPTLDDFTTATLNLKQASPNIGQRVALNVARMSAPAETAGELASEEAMKRLSGSSAGPPPASIQEAIQQAIAEPGQQTPLTAFDLRHIASNLGRIKRQLTKAAETNPNLNFEKGLVTQLESRARADLEAALSKTSPQAHQLYLQAVEFSKGGNDRLLNQYVREVMRARPEDVLTKMWGKNKSTYINLVREAVGEQEFRPLQAQALQDLLTPNAATGEIHWPTVIKRLTKDLGPDTVNAMFPGGHAEQLLTTAELMRDLGKKRWGQMGRYAVEAGQAGGIGLTAYYSLHPALYAALTIPTVAAHVMSSRAGIRWLTTGLKAGPFAKATAQASARIGALLAEEGIETGRWEEPADPNRAPRKVRQLSDQMQLGQPPPRPPLGPRARGERPAPEPPGEPSLYDRTIGAIWPDTTPTPYREVVRPRR